MVKNSDWNGPQGNDDMGRDKLKKDTSGLGYPRPIDISRRVDKASGIDEGFSGKLPSDE